MTALAGVAFWALTRTTPQPLTQFEITPPTAAPLDSRRISSELAISPDGRQIVYLAQTQGTSQLYLRAMDELVSRPIPGTEGAAGDQFFSPDGQSVAFFLAGKLKKVSLRGGGHRSPFAKVQGNGRVGVGGRTI
ncbi:hypothetical protein MYX65_12960 [Acidobacteria bacterium AH-259-L09]|nr:hypothetical protein [Acidobacteria bacterium AH-259-L09]